MKNIMAMSAIFRRCWIVGVFLAMLGLSACGGDPKVDKVLASAEERMDVNPDSVRMVLESITLDSVSGEGERAHYALLLTQARHKCHIDEAEDLLINIAVSYYQDHGPKEHLMKACFYKSVIMDNKHDYRGSTLMALKARELALGLEDDYWVAKVDEQLSFVFTETYSEQEAIKYCKEAAILYNKVGKTRNHRYALCDLAVSYKNMDSLKACQALLDSVIIKEASCGKSMDSNLIAYCLQTAVSAYLKEENYQKAKRSIEQLARFRNYKFEASDYVYKAEVSMGLDRFDSLESIIDSAQSLAKNNTEKALVSSIKSNYFIEKHQYKEALACTDSALKYQNQVVNEALRQSATAAQRDFYNTQVAVNKKRSTSLQRLLFVLGGIFLLFLGIGYYIHRLRIGMKNKEIDDNIREMSSLGERIKSEIEKNAMLSSLLSSQQIEGDSLKVWVEQLFRERWETVNMLCNEFFEKGDSEKPRATIINDVEKEISKVYSPQNLARIEKAVDMYMDGIVSKLRAQCPFLKQDDVLYITLLYAGLAPRAICLFMGIKLKYFYNKRSRLSERILGSEAPDKELFVGKMKQSTGKERII